MKSHTGERNYECSICFKKFLYSYNVVAHIRNVHEKKKKAPPEYYCKFCKEKCWTQNSLNEHMAQVHRIIDVKSDMIEECLYEYENEQDDDSEKQD